MIFRNISIVVAAMLCLACGPFHKSPAVDFTQEFPLESKYENSLQAKWDSKEVLDSKLVEDMEGGAVISLLGNAAVDYTDENSYDGRQSLRYHTSLVDHDVLKAERNAFGGFGGLQGGEAGFAIDFAEPQDWSEYNRLSMWVYIHPSKNPNVHLFITFNNEGSPDNTLSPSRQTNISDIPQGVWHNVVWEIDYTDRDRISQLVVSQHNIGYDRDMGEQFVKIDFDRIEIQKVEPDHYSGWDVAPGQISFSHIGYRPYDAKVALASYSDIPEFTLSDDKGRTVFTGKVEKVSNKGRDFASLDFTSFDRPGTYVLKYGKAESRPFPIGEYVWLEPMFGALNFYYCQRCGYEVPGIHGVCHQDCFGFHGDEQKIVNGGWHDAGDLSQGFFRTSMSAYALMRNLQVIKSDPKLAELAESIARYAPDQSYDIRLGSGIEVLKPGEADAVIIAGMGGILITQILEADLEKVKLFKKMILQPRNNSDVLRKWLDNLDGFAIVCEEVVKEVDKFSEIITVKAVSEINTEDTAAMEKADAFAASMALPEEFYYDIPTLYLTDVNDTLIEYLNRRIEVGERIADSIKSKGQSESSSDQLEEIQQKTGYVRRVLQEAKNVKS